MIRVRSVFFSIALVMYALLSVSFAGDRSGDYRKISQDIDRKFTSIGNIGLTVTNYGTIGTRNIFWPQQPSCEYPRGSRVEHIYQGALWVGANLITQDPLDSRNGHIYVTTGASNQSSRASSSQRFVAGYEFNSELLDSVSELSSLSDDRPPASQFSPLAVSHQDFISDYSDRFQRVPATGDTIVNHTPLGIKVHQESYAWNFPFADFFVIIRYMITNASKDTLDSVYVGLWANAVVRNTNLVRPGTPGYFDFTGQGFDSTRRMAYSFDFTGQPGGPPADSYVGVKLLGTTPFPSNVDSLGDLLHHTFYNAWLFRINPDGTEYESPIDDDNTDHLLSRYSRMTQSMSQNSIDQLRLSPKNVTYLLSTGPFSRLNPGDSVEAVFAVVCAKKFGTAHASNDLLIQRKTLNINAGWAQQAYNGEDANGNNILDPGEDIARRDSISPSEVGLRYEPDGRITRYLLPAPPRRPKIQAEVENQSIVVYWDKSTAEESIDPITGQKDFEGYRIYRSNAGTDFLNHENLLLTLPLVGEFDRSDDNIGPNTGFGKILLDSAKTFPNDTTKYWYRFPPKGTDLKVLNGWQYIYAVSAFDQGDSINGVPSLESAKFYTRGIPGTPSTSDPSTKIGVYPNPYYVSAIWDGGRERLRKIYFYNLPARCEITIYTLAGDVVTSLDHDEATYGGQGIEWFNQFGDPGTAATFAGGEHAWDLITRHDQAIATGLYLFTVEDKANGSIKRGKFLIVK